MQRGEVTSAKLPWNVICFARCLNIVLSHGTYGWKLANLEMQEKTMPFSPLDLSSYCVYQVKSACHRCCCHKNAFYLWAHIIRILILNTQMGPPPTGVAFVLSIIDPSHKHYTCSKLFWPECPELPPSVGNLCSAPSAVHDCHYTVDHCCCDFCSRNFTFSCVTDEVTGTGHWQSTLCPVDGCGSQGND